MRYVCMMLACLLMVGCQEEELFPDYGEGTGTLVISGLEVETVVGDIQTRASSVEDEDIPGNEEFTITLVDKENSIPLPNVNAEGKYDLPAGSYTITAYYGANKMSNEPYFFETKDLVIETGKTRTVTLRPSLQTAVLRPHLDETLVNQYENYKLEIKNGSEETAELANDKDFYLPVGDSYTLTLSGTNKLGNPVSHTWEYQADQFVKAVRYTVNCNPDIPNFTLPAQAETNAWSKFIYVTPMTEENISYVPENMTKAEVLADIVYEASADGQTWTPATTDGDKVVITGLEPSKAYTVRARYGGVEGANPATLTTESAQVVNGDMDEWSKPEYANYGNLFGGGSVYLYSLNEGGWRTRNALTMSGVEGGTSSGTSNQRTAYRWNSCTIETDDAVSGSAAEIRTMALTQTSVSGTEVGSGWFWGTNEVEDFVHRNHRVFSGWLYTGDADVTASNENPNELGISHIARPVSLSFDYKYAPYNGDKCSIYAKLYDKEENEIASVNFETDAVQNSYETINLVFEYTDLQVEAAYIYIMFKSGVNESWDYVQYISGSYDANPWSLDTFVGSVLKIDNVVLNYDYE